MPESSHTDVKLWYGIDPKSCGNVIGKLPSMALDTGILAGMTALTKISYPGLIR
ncbi:MAG: hypothetical protein WCP01_03445 [Methylococcaceae bacterium]